MRRHVYATCFVFAAVAGCSGDAGSGGDAGGDDVDVVEDTGGVDVGDDAADTSADADAAVDIDTGTDTEPDVEPDVEPDTEPDGDPPCDDDDEDGVCNDDDVCPEGDDNVDGDGDGTPDDCDLCAGYDDNEDTDEDGIPNGCDECAPEDPDADGDGVPDGCDLCEDGDDTVDSDEDTIPDACDVCAIGDDRLDADGDGFPDSCDVCAGSDDAIDTDGDGFPDGCDVCAGYSDAEDTDEDGIPNGCDVCDDSDPDGDGDGTPDACDVCPEDGENDADEDGVCAPDDVCAGGDDTVDGDGDGTPDFCDGCPADPAKVSEGICGCGESDVDTDSDDVADCDDLCPDDPAKLEPGSCGCGVADTDTDIDGTPDCLDLCAEDDGKTEPGVCGCGTPDTDTDDDTTPDCIDACAEDPGKIEPGVCGCGVPDVDTDEDEVLDCEDSCPLDAEGDVEPGERLFDCALSAFFDGEPQYVPYSALCDGVPDCSAEGVGAIDEDTCGTEVFDCDGGATSLAITDICDGVADCLDGSDETELCADSGEFGDGFCPSDDNCPLVYNPTQADEDEDGFGDACDRCPADDDGIDTDGDTVPDCADVCADGDDTVDTDGDRLPDCIDSCPTDPLNDTEPGPGLLDCNISALAGGEPDYIPYSSVCDGVVDCAGGPIDGLDEQCEGTLFNCFGEQIGVWQLCDGVLDCPDGSDETIVCTPSGVVGDSTCYDVDNCPTAYNPDQADSDEDGVGDVCDICPGEDDAADDDGDTVVDCFDICPGQDDTVDADEDGIADCADLCLDDPLNDNELGEVLFDCNLSPISGAEPVFVDRSSLCDGIQDCDGEFPGVDEACDGPVVDCGGVLIGIEQMCDGVVDCPDRFDEGAVCVFGELGDGVCFNDDNCPETNNPDQSDIDEDGIGDLCDVCPDINNELDTDGDTVPDCFDSCPGEDDLADTDEDGIADCLDICPLDPANDGDGAGAGDPLFDCALSAVYGGEPFYIPTAWLCDGVVDCPPGPVPGIDEECFGPIIPCEPEGPPEIGAELFCNGSVECPNGFDEFAACVVDGPAAGDGYCANEDNCPEVFNPEQADLDEDGIGDVCDECPGNEDLVDNDFDTVADCFDVCDGDDDTLDADEDGVPDCIDSCPGDTDLDEDGLCDSDPADRCFGLQNEFGNFDGDRYCDDTDRCSAGDDDLDADDDGVPDACDRCRGFDDGLDRDDDLVPDACDNCAETPNPDQANSDRSPTATAVPTAFLPRRSPANEIDLGDDEVVTLEIGFEFEFYGITYNTLELSSNGFVSFGTGYGSRCCGDRNLLNTPDPLIAIYWDDLNPSAAGRVAWELQGLPGTRELVIALEGVPHYTSGPPGPGTPTITAQLVLRESDNGVQIHTTRSIPDGASASQGVTAGGGAGAAFLGGRNNGTVNLTNDGVRFTTDGLDDGVGDVCDPCPEFFDNSECAP